MNAEELHASANDLAAEQVRSVGTAWLQRAAGRYQPWFAGAAMSWVGRAASEATALLRGFKAVVGALSRKAEGTRLQTRPAFVLPLRAPKVSRSRRSSDGPRFALRCTLWPNSAVERTNNGGSGFTALANAQPPLFASHLKRWASR